MRKILFSLIGFFTAMNLPAQNVGIGTTTPIAPLHIKSATSNNPLVVEGVNPSWYSIYEEGIYRGYWGSYSGNPQDVDFGTGAGNATGKLHLTIQASPKVTVDAAGNVGIGTTSPGIGKLQVEAAGSNDLLHLSNGAGTTGLSMSIVSGFPTVGFNVMRNGGYKFIGAGYGGMFQYSTINGDLNYYSSNASGTGGGSVSFLGSFFTLDAAGRLGLSTAAPTAKLHVSGNVVIGGSSVNPATGYLLSVGGKAICEEMKVQLNAGWPDYVFRDDYRLMPIEDLEKCIRLKKHLPNIPSAADVTAEKGIELGEMNRKLLEKIEELTLYIIQLKKENGSMDQRIKRLETISGN